VLAAIRRRDQDAARQAMQNHLASLRRRVKEGADFN
jgi:DNA-binding FadR family transcriptional regulator